MIDWEQRALRAEALLNLLPLDAFGDDMSQCDAADFVDNAGVFFTVMCKWRQLKDAT